MTDLLTPLAVQNMPVLLALAGDDRDTSVRNLAATVGRDPENLRKSLKGMRDVGLLDWPDGEALPDLAEAGRAALAAWKRAHGEGGGLRVIPFDRIEAWELNPRTQFDPDADREMARSIGDKGVLQPLIVRPHPTEPGSFQVIIGERRRRGSHIAVQKGWQPTDFLVPCDVRELTDDEALEIAGVENLQRQDMHWLDEAEWYLKLAARLSAPAIERLVGTGGRRKRTIQTFIQCARELSPELKTRCYAPEVLANGKPNPDYLPYAQARDLVGDKAPRPALQLSPKLACTLLEVVHAGFVHAQIAELPKPGAKLVSPLARPYTGGALATLEHDRSLIEGGFDKARQLCVFTKVTDDLKSWLTGLGYFTNAPLALRAARAAVIGDLHAAELHREGRHLTPELNLPHLPREAAGGGPRPEEGVVEGASPTPDTEEFPPYLRRLAGGSDSPPVTVQASAPAAQTAPENDDDEAAALILPPMLRIVMVEVAHAITHGERAPGAPDHWACVLMAGFHTDTRVQSLIRDRKLIRLHQSGPRTLASLTITGEQWLQDLRLGTFEVATQRPLVTDDTLRDEQLDVGGKLPAQGARYLTPWLNPPAAAAATEPTPDTHPAPEDASATPEPPVSGAQEPMAPPPPSALRTDSMAHALRQCDRLLNKLQTGVKPTLFEIEQHRQLIEAALALPADAAAQDILETAR